LIPTGELVVGLSLRQGGGDETPRVVLLGGREVTLLVEHRWLEETIRSGGSDRRRRIFQVRLEDGRRCRLAQEPDGSWTLSHMADGHERSRLGQVDGGT
jgi:hypothetical protein